MASVADCGSLSRRMPAHRMIRNRLAGRWPDSNRTDDAATCNCRMLPTPGVSAAGLDNATDLAAGAQLVMTVITL